MKEEKDIKIVGMMINMYCHGKHHTAKNEMCEQCSNLYSFVKLKRENCPYGDSKDYCSQCKIHCYQSDSIMRQQIKDVRCYALCCSSDDVYSSDSIVFSFKIYNQR